MRKTMASLEAYSKPAPPSVLSISPDDRDYRVLREMIDPAWTLVQAFTLPSAFSVIRDRRPTAVLCDTDLTVGTWRDVLDHIPPSPDAPRLIVTSRLADEALWAEALNLGAYDVLSKPFDAQEVERILDMACRQWSVADPSGQLAAGSLVPRRKTARSDGGVPEQAVSALGA